jgi:hypothetical protein
MYALTKEYRKYCVISYSYIIITKKQIDTANFCRDCRGKSYPIDDK